MNKIENVLGRKKNARVKDFRLEEIQIQKPKSALHGDIMESKEQSGET